MLMTGMSISGKMSVAIVRSANGVASTIRIAITMNVYGRRRAIWTIDMGKRGAGADGWRGGRMIVSADGPPRDGFPAIGCRREAGADHSGRRRSCVRGRPGLDC